MSEFIIECEYDYDVGWIPGEHREEIVRCRDCKQYIAPGFILFDDGTTNLGACSIVRAYMVKVTPDGFCAWGERRETDGD